MRPPRETACNGLLTDPVFVIGCNRSGTTILFKTLSAHPDLWTRHIENRDEFLHVFPDDGPEGALVREATEEQRREVRRFLYEHAKNRELAAGVPVLQHFLLKLFQKSITDLFKHSPIRVVDKTPSNCFRVDMLRGYISRCPVRVPRSPRRGVGQLAHGVLETVAGRRADRALELRFMELPAATRLARLR